MARRLMALGAIGAALALPAGANAGGWATVGLDSMPEALRATEPWPVELTILQHGRTPLEGVKPRVIVTGWGGKLRQAFPARPTGRPGVYRAVVSFRGPGRFGISVD